MLMTEAERRLLSSKILNMEKEKLVPETAWLFDVDGVLTNPEEKKVVLPEIFDELIKRLQNNEPVGLNTGRSLDYMIAEVLKPIENRVEDKKILKNIFAVGEKGAAWITYNNENERVISVDENISVPEEIQNDVRELVKQKYSEMVFYDETKRTLVTLEIEANKKMSDLLKIEQEIVFELNNILKKYKKEGDFKIDATRVAIDIQSILTGKALGAREFVKLLSSRGIEPKKYIGFGDSASDYEMYEELITLGKITEFVFVGDRDSLEGKDLASVIFTEKKDDEGTLEFLRRIN